MRVLNIAVIGTGFIGPVHIEAIRRLGHRVAGVLGSSPGRGESTADRLGVSRSYASLDELLADGAVDAVHITSPNRYHFEQTCRCIAAGKHVLCEKPLAMTAAEGAELVRLAREKGVVAAVCYNVRFYPLCLEARQRRIAGDIGTILHSTGSYMQDWLLYDTDFNWRVMSGEGGELRAVADIGTHWMDLIQFITGETIVEVCADLKTVHAVRQSPQGSVETFSSSAMVERIPVSIPTEDYGSILLRFADGSRGAVTVSQVTAGRKNCLRFDIAGSKASLSWNSEEPNELTIGRREPSNSLLLRDPGLLSPAVRPYSDYPGGHAEGFSDSFKQLFRAVYASILKGETEPDDIAWPTFADGHRELQVCEAILRSHRENRWVRVEG